MKNQVFLVGCWILEYYVSKFRVVAKRLSISRFLVSRKHPEVEDGVLEETAEGGS